MKSNVVSGIDILGVTIKLNRSNQLKKLTSKLDIGGQNTSSPIMVSTKGWFDNTN